MARQLIIARASAESLPRIADIFRESDRTELPQVAGVSHRSLYHLGDVYCHLIETRDSAGAVGRARSHEGFARVSKELSPFVRPYLATWRGPDDALATCFYEWNGDT